MADLFRKYKSLYSSTANSFSTGSGVTITPASVVGLPTDTEITLTFDRVDSSGTATPSSTERIIGTVSGSNFVIRTSPSSGRGADSSTEQAHTSPVVEMIWNAKDWNDAIDGFLTEHGQDGTHDTTKVVDLTTAQTLTNKTLTSPKINEDVALTATATELNLLDGVTAIASADGWTEAGETWTYASATTFTVSGDATAKYQKGTRIKLTQTTTKYFVVTNSVHSGGTTTVTITGGTDYTLINAAISDNYYSYQANPQGYPASFALASNKRLSVQGKQATVTGWGYTTGTGLSLNSSVTYGVTFAAIPTVLGSYCGSDGSVPTDLSGGTNFGELVGVMPNLLSTIGFTMNIRSVSNSFTNGTHYPKFSWVAVGAL